MAEKPPRPKHFSLIRELALADVFTLANASCGTASIFCCLQYLDDGRAVFIWVAMALLPVALVMDALDGRVARKRAHSRLGGDLDSLADIVSFGVAPAALGFTLGMRGGWDSVVLIYFVVCGISRLARYNVTADELADDSGKVKYYEGTPIPTSVAIVVMLAVAFAIDAVGADLWFGSVRLGWTLHPIVFVYAISGTAMASATLRVPKP